MRASGSSKIDSIAVLKGARGIGLAKAKEIVHFSGTWADTKALDEKFHEDLVMTAYDDEIRKTLKAEIDAGRLKEVGDAADVFGLVKKIYPRSGSKIDWDQVPGAIEDAEEDQSRQITRFIEFFDEMCAKFRLSGLVLYVGDSLTNFALASSVADVRRALPVLFEVPQHHYFVGPNGSWCMCMTMEGDMAFGCDAEPRLH